ncbi:ubinuclein-1 isoform X2 [Stigmatopora nigra]
MAQARRVRLTELPRDVKPQTVTRTVFEAKASTDSGCVSGPARAGSPSPDSGSATVRLVVALLEPEQNTFNEFSYVQLLADKGNKDEVQTSNKFEAEEKREQAHITELVRKMEEKYATKKKPDRLQDLIDIGDGYDDEDSFIDNSEAYDEYVPSSIAPEFGGFYVNTGVLQFRQASETSRDESPPEASQKVQEEQKRQKKRSRKVQQDKDDIDAKSSADDDLTKKGKKRTGPLSVTRMLKKFRLEKELERHKTEMAADAGGGSGLADPLLSLIGAADDQALLQAASTVEFDIDLDCLLDVGDEVPSPPSLTEADYHGPPEVDLVTPPTTQAAKVHPACVGWLPCVAFPEGLPPTLEDSIKTLMMAAKTAEGESKLKFFTPEINSILLDIDCQCREHGGNLRSRVYTHLSSFLPCSKETLLKRVKRLKMAEEISNMEDPMWKLRQAIERAMPEQIAQFKKRRHEYEQGKTLQAMDDGSEAKYDLEEDKGSRKGGGPRKLFKWNERVREALCHVLRQKMSLFQGRRKENQQFDDYLKALLVKDFKPLWPKGWMQTRVLLKESRKLLGLHAMFPRKSRSEKMQPSIVIPPVLDQSTMSLPLDEEDLPHEADSPVEGSSASYVTAENNEVIVLDSNSD